MNECWIMKKSTEDSRSYYINRESNISQWGITTKDLPIGWEMLRSRKNNRLIYYYNKQSNTVQIEKPRESDFSKLPAGWVAMRTKKCGSVFYKNSDTNTTQWQYPEHYSEKIEVRSGPVYDEEDIGTFKEFNRKLAMRKKKLMIKSSDSDYKTSNSDSDEDYKTSNSDFDKDYKTSNSDFDEDYKTSNSDFEEDLQNGSKHRKLSKIIPGVSIPGLPISESDEVDYDEAFF